MDCVECDGVAPWRFEAPAIDRFGGRVVGGAAPEASSGSAEYAATLTTLGARTPLVSSELRRLTRE
ncbi:hypothetical protein [Streptomyces sp. NPDC051677]|uniref:hypothetical protein n=1 Tax=Streptomyces sp. NPDC051677 TaxID=3365669 RepID=UPI0037D67D7B